MLAGTLSWVGFGNKVSFEKEDSSNFRKVFEIPFKLQRLDNRYLLRMICEKKKGRTLFFYSFYEILSEESGIIDAVLIDDRISPKNKLFLDIINHKSLRFKLTWLYGLSHIFKKYK